MTNNESNQLALMVLRIAQNQLNNQSDAIRQSNNKAATTQNKPIREAQFPTKELPNYIMDTNSEAGVSETSFVSDPATNKSFKLL